MDKVPFKEKNNHKQGRSGSKAKEISGPAVGSAKGNSGKPLRGGKK